MILSLRTSSSLTLAVTFTVTTVYWVSLLNLVFRRERAASIRKSTAVMERDKRIRASLQCGDAGVKFLDTRNQWDDDGRVTPTAAVMMTPGLEARVFTAATLERLTAATRLVSPIPMLMPGDDWADVEVVVTGWGCPSLDAAVLNRLPALRLVAHAAGTVRGLVTDDLWERDVIVTSAAAANAVPVAEFTFAAVVMALKDVFGVRDRHREVRGASSVIDQTRMGTMGRRIGLIGASTIGRLVIERLHTLDVELAVSDPYLDDDAASVLGVTRMDLDDLLAWADVVSVHAPALPGTRHLLDAAALARMSDGTWLINTARGSLVDTDALTAEVVSGRLCAFIDTPDPEPLPPESPLYDLPNVVLTPHIAGSLGIEIARMGDLAVAEVERFVAGESPLHPVSRDDLERIA
mgnify:CR=1 FL=1